MSSKRPHADLGFTLIETLVALAVVAIGMAALWKGLSQGQHVSQQLPDRIIARWVAQNHLVNRQVMDEWPVARTYEGSEIMGGRNWFWQEEVSNTDVTDMRRITVRVGISADSYFLSLDGYLHRTQPVLPYERIFSR